MIGDPNQGFDGMDERLPIGVVHNGMAILPVGSQRIVALHGQAAAGDLHVP
jgi:hypothetical protein